jgi:hypothetical protein
LRPTAGLGHVDDDGTVSLAGDRARFQGDHVFAVLERFLD